MMLHSKNVEKMHAALLMLPNSFNVIKATLFLMYYFSKCHMEVAVLYLLQTMFKINSIGVYSSRCVYGCVGGGLENNVISKLGPCRLVTTAFEHTRVCLCVEAGDT